MTETILANPKPSRATAKRVLIVGAGVSGLTTALCLRREGIDVTVVAEKFAPNITSVVAGALWEWPPAVCGQHTDQLSLARSKEWCKTSYEVFANLSENGDAGVYMRTATFYLRRAIADDAFYSKKVNELKNHVRDFVHDSGLISRNGVNPASGVRDAYCHLAPLIDTDVYMKWLLNEVRAADCRIVQQAIAGTLKEREAELKARFEADAIVNCSGLGSAQLASDAIYPLRGALVRVVNDGKRFPRIEQAHCVALEGNSNETGFIFIIPRGKNILLLGGLAEPNEWDLDIGLNNYEPIRKMYQRCIDFLPVLKNAEFDPSEVVRTGLRPFRKQNVRLERELGTDIIHNFGHGGSGVTLSWGCAQEVVSLANRIFAARDN